MFGLQILMAAVWLVLAAGTGTPARGEEASEVSAGVQELTTNPISCQFCEPDEETEIKDLDEAGLDRLCRGLAATNDSLWVRTDSLYRAGFFGDVQASEARERAVVHFQLRARTAFDYLTALTGERWYRRVTEATLAVPFGERYANTTVFPIRPLRDGLAGAGGFCLRYGTIGDFDRKMQLGGVLMRIRSDVVEEEGTYGASSAFCVSLESRVQKSVDLLFLSRLCGRVGQETLVDRGDTLEVITVTDLEGMYARKAGTHRMSALLFWRSVTSGDRDPAQPRSGACAYFPRISIRLPLFLPDLGLDDLRDFDLPNPLASMEWVYAHPVCPWLRVSREAYFDPWDSCGPRPLELERRFPDL